jgi:hypothetical protein
MTTLLHTLIISFRLALRTEVVTKDFSHYFGLSSDSAVFGKLEALDILLNDLLSLLE